MLGEDSIYAMNIVDRLNLFANSHFHTEIIQNYPVMTVNILKNGWKFEWTGSESPAYT